MYAFFKLSNKVVPLRVKAADEIGGLDIPEMGVHGYFDGVEMVDGVKVLDGVKKSDKILV